MRDNKGKKISFKGTPCYPEVIFNPKGLFLFLYFFLEFWNFDISYNFW